jgi:predicted nucleic acid-binding protein
MAEKYYIDACIWRDFHENRTDKFRPLGEWAFQLFRLVRETQSKVLYSELVLDELSIAYDEKAIKEIFKIVEDEGLLQKVEIGKEQLKEAAKLKREQNLPFGDALHAIIARDNDAIMVTRDKHFEDMQRIAEIRKPEDLI